MYNIANKGSKVMNILLFLKEKKELVYTYSTDNLLELFEKFSTYRYSYIPVITKSNEYIGSISQGDVLDYIVTNGLTRDKFKTIMVRDIPRKRDNAPIHADQEMKELLMCSIDANFVPVLDANDKFIGIITRKQIIDYFFEHNLFTI